jgi:hypothetical protein
MVQLHSIWATMNHFQVKTVNPSERNNEDSAYRSNSFFYLSDEEETLSI